jgi:hypothetical protein
MPKYCWIVLPTPSYAGWFHGEDLSTYGNRQTLRGRRNAILKAVDVDIVQDVMPLETPPLKFVDIFDSGKVLPDFPEWADQHPAVCYKGQDIPRRASTIYVKMSTDTIN